MSFVTTQPDALHYAAGKLEGIGTSMAAQNASAAASTTGVAPAAADEVSALQATQFTAYGNLYQQISAEATAIQQAFVQMLGTSADSYGATEAANSAGTGAAGLGGFSLLGQLTQFGQFEVLPGALSNGSMIGMYGGNPFISAASSFKAPSPPPDSGTGATVTASVASAELGGVPPAGPANIGTAPVLAGVGQASAVGRLSVPPSWAVDGDLSAASATRATSAGWTSAAPHGAPVTTFPGGVPSMASTGRTSGLGAPRYGLKPKVMPKPTLV